MKNNYSYFKKEFFTIFLVINSFFAFSQSYGEYFRRYDIYGGLFNAKTRTYSYGLKYLATPSSPAVYDTIKGDKGTIIGPTVGFGLNLPFFTFGNDNMSVGAHVAANLGLGGGTGFLYAPLGLQYRFGTDATQDSDIPFGFSIGGGYNLFLMSGDAGEGFFKYPYVSPEINFVAGRFGLIKVKGYFQFTEQYKARKLDTETLHTYMTVPAVVVLAVCPNFDN